VAWFTARDMGRIVSTYTSDLGKLSWTWVMKADGRVLYRLSHINGRAEHNAWRLLYRLTATERWQIGTDPSKAAELLARMASERGHQLVGAHR